MTVEERKNKHRINFFIYFLVSANIICYFIFQSINPTSHIDIISLAWLCCSTLIIGTKIDQKTKDIISAVVNLVTLILNSGCCFLLEKPLEQTKPASFKSSLKQVTPCSKPLTSTYFEGYLTDSHDRRVFTVIETENLKNLRTPLERQINVTITSNSSAINSKAIWQPLKRTLFIMYESYDFHLVENDCAITLQGKNGTKGILDAKH